MQQLQALEALLSPNSGVRINRARNGWLRNHCPHSSGTAKAMQDDRQRCLQAGRLNP